MIGSPLDLHETSGLAAIRKANLLEEFKKNFRRGGDKKVIVNERAEIFFSDHETKPDENFDNEHFRPEIDRGPLRNILLESLQAYMPNLTMLGDAAHVMPPSAEKGVNMAMLDSLELSDCLTPVNTIL